MMRTEDPTVTPDDLRRLIHARAGSPVRPARIADTPDVLDVLTEAAMRLRDELDAYIRRNVRLAAACHETLRCAGPDCTREIIERETGRVIRYCSPTCRQRARRARTQSSPAIRGAIG